MSMKFDGVIEAAHFKNGQIALVRAYERRGASFSDRVLIERKDLLERLKQGKKFVTGSRKEYWGGTFEVGKPVLLLSRDGKEILSTREGAERDELENVPLF